MQRFTREQWDVVQALLDLYAEYIDAQDFASGDHCVDQASADAHVKETDEAFENLKSQVMPLEPES